MSDMLRYSYVLPSPTVLRSHRHLASVRLRPARPGRWLCAAVLALSTAGCGQGETSSGAGYLAEAALGIGAGVALGTMLAKETKHGGEDALPPSIPLMPEDLEAIALLGSRADPCQPIFRTPVSSFQNTVTTGGNAWSGGGCSLGPGTVDSTVEHRARKLAHEVCHKLGHGSEAAANDCEREISAEVGLI